jgi:hypothetical protein
MPKEILKPNYDNIIDAAKHYDYYKLKYSSGRMVNLNFPDFDYKYFKPTK